MQEAFSERIDEYYNFLLRIIEFCVVLFLGNKTQLQKIETEQNLHSLFSRSVN